MNSAENQQQPSILALDKPLAELTEEDIAQLTREDCRRFLKDRGMRRPSWNKSQAIQQVVSLKALLEGRPGAGDSPAGPGIFQKSPPGLPKEVAGSSPRCSSQVAVDDTCPYRRRDPPPVPVFGAGEVVGSRIPGFGKDEQPNDNRRQPERLVAEKVAGQMTIFYDGKVNVYDGVSSEQARLIMDVAASSGWSEDEEQVVVPYRPPVPHFNETGASVQPQLVGITPVSASAKVPRRSLNSQDEGGSKLLREMESVEGPTTRKASVQRYLEKKKDRFKGKRYIVGSTSSSMDMMSLGQKFKCHNPNESVVGMDRSSNLSQSPGTPARCISTDNQSQKVRLSIDLNADGGEN